MLPQILLELCEEELFFKSSLGGYRSGRSRMFFKVGVLKNFANFTGKQLCWSLFLKKLQAFRSSDERTPFLQNTSSGYLCSQYYRTSRNLPRNDRDYKESKKGKLRLAKISLNDAGFSINGYFCWKQFERFLLQFFLYFFLRMFFLQPVIFSFYFYFCIFSES